MEVKNLLMKLISSLIICTILCMSLNGFFNISVAAETITGTVNVSSDKSNVRIGETFTITVTAECNEGVFMLNTTLKYDKNCLEIVKKELIDSDNWAVSNIETIDDEGETVNDITIYLNVNNSEKIKSARLYQIEFKVKNTVESGTKLAVNFEKTKMYPDTVDTNEINIGTKTVQINTYKTSLTSSKYTVANSKVSRISPKTTIAQLKSNLTIVANDIKIYDLNGNTITDNTTLVGTGMRIVLDGDNIYTLVVTGDIDGDGDTNIIDLLLINKHRLGKSLLTGIFLTAGDTNNDEKIDIIDLLQINKARLGKITL